MTPLWVAKTHTFIFGFVHDVVLVASTHTFIFGFIRDDVDASIVIQYQVDLFLVLGTILISLLRSGRHRTFSCKSQGTLTLRGPEGHALRDCSMTVILGASQ